MKRNQPETQPDSQSTLRSCPDGWCWSKVGEVGEVKLGRQRSPEHHNGQHMRPYLRVANVYEDRIDLSDVLEMNFTPQEFEQYQLRYGDLLLNEGQSLEWVGRPAMYRDELPGSCFQNTLIRFRPHECVSSKFALLVFRYYLHSKRFQRIARWTVNIAHLGAARLSEVEFPVPPLQEQGRIVNKAEELLSDIDAAVAVLLRIKKNLKRYRAAVLKAAVEGKLTEEWRSQQRETEPASLLLNRILQERRCRWGEAQVAKFNNVGKEPPKGWQAKYQEPASPERSMLADLPPGWCWAGVNQVGFVQLGRQRSPQHHNGTHMRPYLRVANVFEDRIDTTDILQMNFTPEEYETYQLVPGDILLNEGQSLPLVGRPAMYRGEVPGACFQNTLIRFRAVPGLVPQFGLYVFLAYLHNKRFQKLARWTVNIAHLGGDRFGNVEFPLPPTKEQQEIVREIEGRLSLVDQTAVQIAVNLKRAARLRQSILKRAFEGKLVPQDPADEPADKLLERIRAARNGAATAKPPRRRRRKEEAAE